MTFVPIERAKSEEERERWVRGITATGCAALLVTKVGKERGRKCSQKVIVQKGKKQRKGNHVNINIGFLTLQNYVKT